MSPRLLKQCVAEFIGTFALIFIGVGAIYHNQGLLAVALAHGLTIAVMASALGAISGGQFNPAVTFGLFVGGRMTFQNSVFYWIAQLAGASAAAFILLFLFSHQIEPGTGKTVLASSIVANGTPDLPKTGINFAQGIIIETILTFFLVVVVYGTAVDARAPKIAGLAIGFTVTLDILFGGPFTGAAMNPARTFGPALASGHWNNQVVYWIGPMLGGALGGLVYGHFLIREDKAV